MIHAFAAAGARKTLEKFTYTPEKIGPHEVEIGIDFCGLCYSDVHLIDDDWKITKYPLVPGHEIIGRVLSFGSDVTEFKMGQTVGVGWQCGSCHTCEFCLRGDETVCSSKVRTCVDRFGGFADKIVIDHRFVYPIPQGLLPEAAAPLLCGGITVYSPFRIYNVQAPQSVAVIGIGGLGHLALQFARAFGCDVTAISTSSEKEAEAKKFGAHHFLTFDNLSKATGKFDFILSTIHADIDWAAIGLLLRPYGKLCFVGLPNNDIKFPARLLVSGNRSLCGSGTGSRSLMNEMLTFCARHKIAPQIELMPMTDVNKAIDKLKANKARYRIVLHN
jgi:uncharacterized zinc-type alcohol dehydrogenase-like protein